MNKNYSTIKGFYEVSQGITHIYEQPTEAYFICNTIAQSLDARQFALHIIFDIRLAIQMFNVNKLEPFFVPCRFPFINILHFKWKNESLDFDTINVIIIIYVSDDESNIESSITN